MAFCVVDFSKGKIVGTLEQYNQIAELNQARRGGGKNQNQEVFHFKQRTIKESSTTNQNDFFKNQNDIFKYQNDIL